VARTNDVVGSTLVRGKNQYRVFFDDNAALYVTFENRALAGIMPVTLDHIVRCTDSREDDSSGKEVLLFGSDDGWVFQMDAGTSFDGAAIEAFFIPHFNHLGSPTRRKRVRRLTLDIETAGSDVSLDFEPIFSGGRDDAAPSAAQTLVAARKGGLWNTVNWDDFVWSGELKPNVAAKVDGVGTDFTFTAYSEDAYEEPHTVRGYTIQYSDRREER
jgi:hypothetical protein